MSKDTNVYNGWTAKPSKTEEAVKRLFDEYLALILVPVKIKLEALRLKPDVLEHDVWISRTLYLIESSLGHIFLKHIGREGGVIVASRDQNSLWCISDTLDEKVADFADWVTRSELGDTYHPFIV